MNYSSARSSVDGIEAIDLRDDAHDVTVSIVPSIGNIAWKLKAGGKDLLWFPYRSLAEFKKEPALCGIPFLAPWANRLDGDGFFANGRRYPLNPGLGNLRRDENQLPIHGLLCFSPAWEVTEVAAGANEAHVTSRLEYWRYPDLMAQFPFAHSVAMTYRLQDGVLEVATRIQNLSKDPMPVGHGYHPYFQMPGIPQGEWKIHVAAREHVELSKQLLPTGQRRPVNYTSGPLDDVFTGLIRESDGKARFSVEGKGMRISVLYGPRYEVAVVYAPAGKGFICFEPMTAVTNAFNLAHEGKYAELQSIPPGEAWAESFWIASS